MSDVTNTFFFQIKTLVIYKLPMMIVHYIYCTQFTVGQFKSKYRISAQYFPYIITQG